MKLGLRIWVFMVVMLIVSALSAPLYAQIDAAALARAQRQGQDLGLGGSNPFDTTEGEDDEKKDSTAIRKIRKPLESYYFDDSVRAWPNFQWTVDRYMNEVEIAPLDTLVTDWRIDYPYFRKGVGDMTLGGLGQSTLPFNYFERPNSPDF